MVISTLKLRRSMVLSFYNSVFHADFYAEFSASFHEALNAEPRF